MNWHTIFTCVVMSMIRVLPSVECNINSDDSGDDDDDYVHICCVKMCIYCVA